MRIQSRTIERLIVIDKQRLPCQRGIRERDRRPRRARPVTRRPAIKIDQSFIDDIDIAGGDGGDGAAPNIVAVVERVENDARRRAPLTMAGCLHWTFVKFSLAR